jgi:DNA-3-methyladenine glycosylase II
MQTRGRAAAAKAVEIGKAMTKRSLSKGGLRKTAKHAIGKSAPNSSVSAVVSASTGAGGHHPLEVCAPAEERQPAARLATPPKTEDPTLATLRSPITHRLVHIPQSDLHATFLTRASQHLISVDSRFKALLDQHTPHFFSPQGLAEGMDPFKMLTRGILSQQVSNAAARSIIRKFILLFGEADGEGNPPEDFFPTPQMVLEKPVEVLRTAGLSGRKCEYVLDLSARFVDGRLNAHDMLHDSDETIIEKLVQVHGIGKWSMAQTMSFANVGAEMFLIFALKRPDVMSTGDLGIQRGMAVWTGKSITNAKGKTGKWKYMSEKEMIEEAEKWKPYRSLGCWLMWRVDGPVSAPAVP